MSNLVKDCLTVNLQVGCWMGYRLDKTMTAKVTQEADAAPDAARVNKHLIPKAALAEIVSSASAIRHHFYSQTLPWKDSGDRLLVRSVALEFIDKHTKLNQDFESAVDVFLKTKYFIAMEQAEFRMGEMFNPDDYPAVDKLRHRFYVHLDIDEIGKAHDIRLNNSDEIIQERVTKAMSGLWEKLAEPLKKFTDTMSDEDAIFRNTLVGNLREIVNMIPALNFSNDPALERIREEIETKILPWEPDDLRKNKATRVVVAGEARNIMDSMAAFMRGMGYGGNDDDE